MTKQFVKYLLLTVAILAFSVFTFAFDEDSEISIGVKRSVGKQKAIASSSVSFLIYDEKASKFRQLKNSSVVKSGQQFIINVKNSEITYLYILNIDAKKKIYSLFPHGSVSQKNPIRSNVALTLPPVTDGDETAVYEFDNNKGKERYYVFVSRTKLRAIEKIIKNIPVDGVKVRSSVRRTLNKYYKAGRKNITSKPGASKVVWFKKYYAKKLVFKHK